MDSEIETLIGKQLNNKLNKVNNGIYLRDEDIYVLTKYKIPYENCKSMEELIYLIERELEGLEDDELDELELLSQRISEFYYYNMSHK